MIWTIEWLKKSSMWIACIFKLDYHCLIIVQMTWDNWVAEKMGDAASLHVYIYYEMVFLFTQLNLMLQGSYLKP